MSFGGVFKVAAVDRVIYMMAKKAYVPICFGEIFILVPA